MSNFQCISVKEALQLMVTEDPAIIDVRSKDAYLRGNIPNAIHMDNTNLFDCLNKIDHARPVMIYCNRGNSSKEAAKMFSDAGFKRVFSLDGGYTAWDEASSGHHHGSCCGGDH